MIGDGVNDSPALSEADAGVAISTGAAIAREIADITISSEDLFELVTLPVEFNASNRAKAYMQLAGYQGADISGSSAVLRSCAMTYVAAALTSILQLLWLVSQNRD